MDDKITIDRKIFDVLVKAEIDERLEKELPHYEETFFNIGYEEGVKRKKLYVIVGTILGFLFGVLLFCVLGFFGFL